jgi:phosphohistidine phosphatase
MELLVIRHAIADDRAEWARSGRPDTERPVTPEGREKMLESARGIRALVSGLDLVATSPLTRAAETAAIVSDAFGGVPVVDSQALLPGANPTTVTKWLATRSELRIALVGHEPDLGALVSWFLWGAAEGGVPLKKGGACLLEFDAAPEKGTAVLKWFAPPRLLRRLGD